MLYVFYGPDTVSARDKVSEICSKNGVLVQVEQEGAVMPDFTGDLFGGLSAYLFRNALKTLKKSELEQWAKSHDTVFFIEESLTEKKKKELPEGAVLEAFNAPKGLLAWLEEKGAKLGVHFSKGAGQYILQRLGFTGTKFSPSSDTFSRLNQELLKFSAYSTTKEISEKEIAILVASEESGFAFGAVDAVLSGNVNIWVREFEKIYGQEDEAGASIMLVGAFAESLRAIHCAQVAIMEKVPITKLASELGWADWKTRKVSQLATRMPIQKTVDTLNKLLALDKEIKTSGLPPRAVLTLIAAVTSGAVV